MRGPSSYPPPPQYGGYQRPEPDRDPFGPADKNQMINLLTPRTVVQLAVWILMFGLGAGLAGLVLFAVYQGQVNNLREELLQSQEELQKSVERRLQQAPQSPAPQASLNVSGTAADPTNELVQSAAPAIVGVSARGSGNQTVSGTGFVVNSTDSGTWVVTSYSLVSGVEENSQVSVKHKNSQLIAELYATDPARDLALVIYQVPAERSLRLSRTKELKEGDQVWALGSARGNPYATGVAAKITSVSPSALGLDAEIAEGFIGGPLLNEDGRVVGVLTSRGGGSGSAVPIELVCQQILRCPSTARTSATPKPTGSPSPGARPAPPAPAPAPAPAPPAPDVGGTTGDGLQQPPPSDPLAPDVPIG
jgi:S1-C subfamily serine protease